MKIKKFASIAVLTLALVSTSTVIAKADEGQPFSATLTLDNNGYAMLDGSTFNRYYHLTPGNASLEVTTFTPSDSVSISLYRERTGPDARIATASVNGTGWYNLANVDQDSWSYYLYLTKINAANPGATVYISGKVHDHHA